jgi:outer membrane receptor protein involved in Fe transport
MYNGSAYASDDVSNIGQKAKAYWLSQWSLHYKKKNMSIYFQVNNIFNQPYAVFTVYDASTQNNSYYPGVG